MGKRNDLLNKGQPSSKIDSDFFYHLSLLVVFTSLAIAPFTFDAFVIPKILVLYVGFTTLGIIVYSKKIKIMSINKLPVWLRSVLVVLVVLMICSAAYSQTPLIRAMFGQFGRGLGLFYYFGALLVFLLASMTYRNAHEARFTKLMTYVSVFLGVYAILQTLNIDVAKMNAIGFSRVVLTYGNSNFAGGMLSVLFGFIFTRSFRLKSLNYKDLIISLLLLFGVYKSGAVQGYLIALFVIIVVVPIRLVVLSKSRNLKFCLYFFWGLTFVLSALGALGIGPISRVFEKSTFQMRIEYWSIGLRILRDNLLFGVGPDRLYDITPQYMTPGSLKFITTTTMDSPHNWFLSFGCSFGLLALITLMVLLLYPVITYLKKSNLSNFLINPSAPTFIALLCLLIDSLVSIEQTGLGIWLYFFAGKILASTGTKWVEQENWVESSQQQKEVKVSKASLAIAMSLALISSAVVMNRFTSDALLRSSIQSVMLKSQAESDYRRIETLAIRLRAEPEYVVQAVPELAKAGDGEALLNISKAYFAYNQKSHQARAIRFQVLNAVTSPKNSCPLLPALIENTAWDRLFVEQYIFCIDQGYFGLEKNSLLQLIEKYIDISFPKTRDNQVSVVNLKARAIYAHLQFQLGKVEIARLLQKQIINDLNIFKNADPNIDVSEVSNHLKF